MFSASAIRQKFLKKLPALDADILLQISSKKEKAFLLAHPEYKLNFLELLKFFCLLFRYRRGMPVAYLSGVKEFFGLNFFVNKFTLIPRPDTETLVEEAIARINSEDFSILIDVGTGSGCIPIAILKNIKNSVPAMASDISYQALKIAEKNAKFHDTKISFYLGNLLEPIRDLPIGKLLITANLPYLTGEHVQAEPSLKMEPRSALVAKENGLALYRELLEQLGKLNRSFTALFEFDPRQTKEFEVIIKKFFPQGKLKIKTDLAGRDRLAILTN